VKAAAGGGPRVICPEAGANVHKLFRLDDSHLAGNLRRRH
jgi:hypothetical protein